MTDLPLLSRLPRLGQPGLDRLRRIGIWALGILLVLLLLASLAGVLTVRRSFPDLGGELRMAGLTAPVTVHRDTYGIPQVYADTAEDLFRAQGFLHAQDRFWEMDFRRHVTAGRLAEMFGASQVEADSFLRTLGWRRVAEQELPLLAPDTQRYLGVYAEGVNAWLAEHGGATASLEYAVLGLQNPDYTIEPWSPVDSLAWLKAMAWDLRGNMETELTRTALLASGLTRSQVEDLYPAYPFDRNLPIVTGGAVVGGAFDPIATPPATGGAAGGTPDGAAGWTADGPAGGGGGGGAVLVDRSVVETVTHRIRALPHLLGTAGQGIGSNSWVISGQFTQSGRPLLANDPHLSPTMPGIWYQMGLHCACEYNVAGFTFSGVPGVIIGHNERIAWGFTNLDPDVTDIYLERLDGDRVLVGDEWQPVQRRQEVIKVAGGEDVTITVRSTSHGPLLSDVDDDLRDLGARPPVDGAGAPAGSYASLPAGAAPYGLALRWTALEPGRTADAITILNRATNWSDFRAAAAMFEVPSQNLVYADVDGNIGYQSPGRVPIRGRGDGRWPAPGWDPAYDWTGYLPFTELPSVLNPARGYVVTANQAVVGPQYQRRLTSDWSYGYRSQRIYDMLDALVRRGGITVADVERMQFDNRNGFAPALVPELVAIPVTGFAARAQRLLLDWDFQQPAGGPVGSEQGRQSAAAAYYNAVWRALLSRTFDELPPDRAPDGGDRWWEVVRALLDRPASPWWDARGTPAVEQADDILRAALVEAADELRRDQGEQPGDWRWGRMHTLTVRNQTFGESGIGVIEWLFNTEPVGVSGGDAIVNATGWDAAEGYQVTAVPSMRMVVDLSNLDGSRWIQLTGNSGHAFHPNYTDQFDRWRTGGSLPMRWERETIEAEAEHTLTLRPA